LHINALLACCSGDSCQAIFPAGLDAQDECDDMDVDGYDDFSDDAGITAHENTLGSSSCLIFAVHYALTAS